MQYAHKCGIGNNKMESLHHLKIAFSSTFMPQYQLPLKPPPLHVDQQRYGPLTLRIRFELIIHFKEASYVIFGRHYDQSSKGKLGSLIHIRCDERSI